MAGKFAILVDGGFIKKKLQERNKRFPTVSDIQTEVERIKNHQLLRAQSLLRVYYYDAPPAAGVIVNPLNSERTDLSATPNHANNTSLQQTPEMQADFALRSGDTGSWLERRQRRYQIIDAKASCLGRQGFGAEH